MGQGHGKNNEQDEARRMSQAQRSGVSDNQKKKKKTMSSSSSSVAAPAVVDKHADLLKMVAQCNHYKCTSRRKAHKATSKEEKDFFFLTFLPFVLVAQWCARSA
jgi:hypothetical protein